MGTTDSATPSPITSPARSKSHSTMYAIAPMPLESRNYDSSIIGNFEVNTDITPLPDMHIPTREQRDEWTHQCELSCSLSLCCSHETEQMARFPYRMDYNHYISGIRTVLLVA